MKIAEYNQMMKYLTRPARSEPEYEQVAMAGAFKGGKKLIEKLLKKGDIKKGEAPKTDVEKVQSKVESDQKSIQKLSDNNQIPVKDQTVKSPYKFTGDETLDDPGMLDDIFNKMYPDYSEGGKYELPLPGEEPLTKKKRTLNAEGGVIGGGMIEGEDLGDRTGFARPKPVPPTGSENFLKKILKQKNLKSWEDMTPTQKYTFSNITFPNYLKQQKEIGDKIPAKELAKKLGITVDQLKFTRKIRTTRTGAKTTSPLGDKIKEVLGDPLTFDNIAGAPRGQAVGSAAFYNNPSKEDLQILKQYVPKSDQSNVIQRPILERMKKLTTGKKGEKFLNIIKKENLSNTKTLEKLQKFFPEYTADELGTVITRTAQVMDGQQFRGVDFINTDRKTASKIFTEIQSAKYGNPLRTASYQLALKGLDKQLKGKDSLNFKTYRDYIQKELKKIGLKGALDIDEYFGVSVGGLKEGFHDYSVFSRAIQSDLNAKNLAAFQGTLSKYINELDTIKNKKELFKRIDEMNKVIKGREKDLKVDLPKFYKGAAQQAFGKKRFAELQAQGLEFKTGRPYSIQIPKGAMTQKEILSSLRSGKGVTKTLDQITKDAVAYSTAKKMKGPKLKSVVIPGAQSFADFTSSIIDDVAKGAYGRAALKKLGLIGTYFGGKDAVKTLGKGESGAEAVADFLGLKGIAQDAMETASLTPEGRDIKQRTAREQYQKNLQESGFMGGGLDQSGIASLYPTEPDQPVTEAEARQLQTEQDIYGSRKEGIEQLRRQAGDIQLQQFKSKFGIPYDLNREYAYGGRVEMKIGGDPKDKKKTTPALDKPTIPIDPNAPVDPGRRDFMEKGAGLGALGVGLATGAVKFAPEIKKAVTGVTSQIDQVPNIVNELYFTIKNFGKQTDYPKPGSDTVKYEFGPYKMEEGPGGYNITKTTDSDYRYQEEYFEVYKDPETGAIQYEELTVRPDMDGKLKDVDYGVNLDTYREIGEDLAKIKGDDSLIKIADDDIAKQIEKEEAFKKSLQKKGTGEND